jgi:hypothetical protein
MGNGYGYEGNLDMRGISEGTKKKDEHSHHEQTRRTHTHTHKSEWIFHGGCFSFFVYYISHYSTFFLSFFPGSY